MIEVSNLVKKYGNHLAVDNLNFKVEKGQVYGFLGPNGAGKSTTMNMITGYLASTEGTITIDGYDISKEPEKAKKLIGYLPELPPVYQDMTVREYLYFAAELKGIVKKEIEEQVAFCMDKTQVRDVADRLIKNLSKGFRQRVGFAQALLGNPEVLILDEPSVGLDPAQIIEIRELIRELGREHTVILSSHILSEVSAVCDHILIISKGKMVANDTPENLVKKFTGKDNINLEIVADETCARSMLEGLGVSEYEISKNENGIISMLITSENDIRKEIYEACVKNNITLLTMYIEKRTLEDIFLELTKEAVEDDSNI